MPKKLKWTAQGHYRTKAEAKQAEQIRKSKGWKTKVTGSGNYWTAWYIMN